MLRQIYIGQIGLIALLLSCQVSYAQIEKQVLEGYGDSVDIDNEYMIVGGPRGNWGVSEVRFLRRQVDQWIENDKAEKPIGSQFGWAVATEGDRALISDIWDDSGCGLLPECDGTGAVFFYLRNGDGKWEEVQTLVPNKNEGTARSNRHFGLELAISGNWALVRGKRKSNPYDPIIEVVYFFEYEGSSWIQRQEFIGGGAIDIRADIAMRGNRLYRLSSGIWSEDVVLEPSVPNLENFGFDVALDENRAAVTALSYNHPDGGHVFIFRNTSGNWIEEAILRGTAEQERYGHTVDLDGNVAIVGDGGEDTGGHNTGSVYVFELEESKWQYKSRLYGSMAGRPGFTSHFGLNLQIVGREVVVGSLQGSATQDVFIFDIDQSAPAPIPVSPSGAAVIDEFDVTFQWSLIEGALSYNLQVWPDVCCGNNGTAYLEMSLLSPSHVISNFEVNYIPTGYFWRVAAEFTEGTGPYSQPEYFIKSPPAGLDVDDSKTPPMTFELESSYPNPFRSYTTISYSLLYPGRVELKIYNVLGELIEALEQKVLSAGQHTSTFDATGLASGIYFYTLSTGDFTRTKRMVLIR